MNTGGKKVYGYLKADVKAIVNGIVDELAKEEKVAECYKQWLESKSEILHYYKDADAEQLPLSEQKELKSIKNMVIREAVRTVRSFMPSGRMLIKKRGNICMAHRRWSRMRRLPMKS